MNDQSPNQWLPKTPLHTNQPKRPIRIIVPVGENDPSLLDAISEETRLERTRKVVTFATESGLSISTIAADDIHYRKDPAGRDVLFIGGRRA